MNYQNSVIEGGTGLRDGEKAAPVLLSATTIVGDGVCNRSGVDLGKIKDIMIDTHTGKVRYAVLSFGGFLNMGEKLFAVPWDALTCDGPNKCFVLNVEKDRLEHAPGFDKDHWPNMADRSWEQTVHAYYATDER